MLFGVFAKSLRVLESEPIRLIFLNRKVRCLTNTYKKISALGTEKL